MKVVIYSPNATIVPTTDLSESCMYVVPFSVDGRKEFENICSLFVSAGSAAALDVFENIKLRFLSAVKANVAAHLIEAANGRLVDLFTEIEWLLHDKAVREEGYYRDQIVGLEPILESVVLYYKMLSAELPAVWLDCRDFVRTDEVVQAANIDIDFTENAWKSANLKPANTIYVTQLGVGSSDECENTTLNNVEELLRIIEKI